MYNELEKEYIDKVYNHSKIAKIVCLMRFGSHLYGTANENSDIDIKGIFIPTLKSYILGSYSKTISFSSKKGDNKNSSEDIDIELFSLPYFIQLACEGQTVALDMLHNENIYYCKDYIWEYLQTNRKDFYSKCLHAFSGYAYKQAAKYGVKGSRIDTIKRVLAVLREYCFELCCEEIRLRDIWGKLPSPDIFEHIRILNDFVDNIDLYEVCGTKFQNSAKVDYIYKILEKKYNEYGERARLAEKNQEIDWKAMSHALRCCYQMIQMYEEGIITFPLKQADYLKQVKQGKLDFNSNVLPELESRMDRVRELAKISEYPEKADKKKWEEFVIRRLENYYYSYLHNKFERG